MTKGILRTIPEKSLSWALKAFADQLPTYQKLFQKKVVAVETKCPLCNQSQSLYHVLNGCPATLDRMKRRHDAVLELIASRLRLCEGAEEKRTVWADISGSNDPSNYPLFIGESLREQFRPDIMLQVRNLTTGTLKLVIIELSCPYETAENLKNRHSRKVDKYTLFVHGIETYNSRGVIKPYSYAYYYASK